MLDRYSALDCCPSSRSFLGLLAALLLVLGAQPAVAQEVTVEGTVVDAETGAPLPGVNVVQVGTERGTATDADGTFQLDVLSEDAELRFSFVGYQTKTVPLRGRTQLTVRLTPAAKQLEGVVVTALGVEREQRALGYSVDEIEGAAVERVPRVNVAGALAGRVSGVKVSQSGGGPGASSRIVVRGSNSFNKNNQALIVLDGVPINNTQLQPAGSFGGFDYGGGITNLAPNNIKSISVLKGPNAAALYGTRAANGAVVITTKKGKAQEGLGVSYNASYSFNTPTVWPDEKFQNTYGRGSQGKLCLGSTSKCTTADGTPISDPSLGLSFGPRMEGQEVQRFNGKVAPYSPQKNNVRDFYDQGSTVRNSVALSGGNEAATFRASYSNLQNDGFLPDQELNQNTLMLAGTGNLSDNLSATGRATYIKRTASNRPNLADNPDNTVRMFLHMPRSVRLQDLKPYRTTEGKPVLWNGKTSDAERQNPFWTVNLNTNNDERDRLLGQLKATYDFTDWLSLQVRGATDLYTGKRRWRRAVNTSFEATPDGSKFRETKVRVEEINYDALLTAKGALSDDFSGELRLGGNRFMQNRTLEGFTGSSQAIENFFVRTNARNLTPFVSVGRREIQSVYALGEVGFRDYAFLNVTARNDWSSTLPEGNRSFFYPSVNGSLILTEAFDLEVPGLSFAKIRGSWSQTGNDASPFQLQETFTVGGPRGGSFQGLIYSSVADVRPNPDLKPEITNSYEVGARLGAFDDRLNLEFTYYSQTTENQTLSIPISSASGFSAQVINVGKVSNSGIEGRLSGTILQTENLQWDLSVNASTNESTVEDLPGDIETRILGTNRMGVQVVAKEGGAFGNLVGTKYKRNDNGEIIVNSNGIPKEADKRGKIGNYQPDWTGGASTTLRWKNLSLRALLDTRQGGDIYSTSNVITHGNGNHKATLKGRDGGFVFDGVKEDGSENDISVSPEAFWTSVAAFPGGAIDEEFVYDASYIRLRELSLSYSLPTDLLGATPLQSARITLTGKNLFFLERHTDGFDPTAYTRASTTGVQGLEYAPFPNTKSYGINLNVTF